jgi:hypothetical protein
MHSSRGAEHWAPRPAEAEANSSSNAPPNLTLPIGPDAADIEGLAEALARLLQNWWTTRVDVNDGDPNVI